MFRTLPGESLFSNDAFEATHSKNTFIQSIRLTSRILKEISSTGQTKIETCGLALSLPLPLHFASLRGGGCKFSD